jgi:hypothetical protein
MPQAQRLFGAMPAGAAASPTLPAPPPMAPTREVFKVPGAQAQIFMAALAPAFTHPDYPALKVMSAILGGGMASRFFSELRDKQALAYSTAALYPPRLDTSGFVAILGTGPDNLTKAEAALKDQLRRIQTEPASEQEVAVARSYVVGTQAMDRRTNARQAWYLAAAELEWERLPAVIGVVEHLAALEVDADVVDRDRVAGLRGRAGAHDQVLDDELLRRLAARDLDLRLGPRLGGGRRSRGGRRFGGSRRGRAVVVARAAAGDGDGDGESSGEGQGERAAGHGAAW